MKVYFLTREPFPNGMAATKRLLCYARALKNENIESEILAITRTETFDSNRNNFLPIGFAYDIKYVYIGGKTTRSKFRFMRFCDDQIDKLKTIIYLAKNIKCGDVVFFYCDFYLDFTLKVIQIFKQRRVSFVRELCELPFGTSKENKKSKHMRLKTFKKQFPLLDGFVCISDSLYEVAKKYGEEDAEYIKIPILVDFDEYRLEDKSDHADVPYIFHSGTLYEQKDGILGMLEAFGLAVKELNVPMKFILTGRIGKSPHTREINEIIAKYDMKDRVVFTGYLSNSDLKSYLSKASLVIINKYETQQNKYCFSTKLGEYLAAAKPLIITSVGEATNWLNNGESAYIVPPHDINAMSKAIIHAMTNHDERKQIGLKGQFVCKESFDFKVWSKRFVHFLNNTINKQR